MSLERPEIWGHPVDVNPGGPDQEELGLQRQVCLASDDLKQTGGDMASLLLSTSACLRLASPLPGWRA